MPHDFDEIIPRENTDSVKYDDGLKRFGRADVQPLWVADMDFRAPECVQKVLRETVEHGIYGYQLKTEKYYRAISDWFERRHRYAIDPTHIFFTPGVITALSCLVRALTADGDQIIIQPPVYHPFPVIVQTSNRRLLQNQLREEGNRYSIDFDDLEQKAKEARMLILCSPHNPVGRVWRREELTRIAEICLRHHVLIASDEIHNDLVYPPHRHIAIGSLSPEVDRITVTCHAPSKTFNLPSLSTAYVSIRDPELRQAYQRLATPLHLDAINVFGLRALVAGYTRGEPWLGELLEYLQGNYRLVCDYLGKNLPSVKVSPLEGTYLVWLDFRQYGFSPEKLRAQIIEQAGLGLNDGPTFGPGGEGFQRMNIACPRQKLLQALHRLEVAFGPMRK
ncbi:MAG TPA: PatB family C-S lyase [Candidatus Sulfotelmatobacter sp.]|nr:PatB family C-S lyase [Candidatus Sulfotelmatobacter sp.]